MVGFSDAAASALRDAADVSAFYGFDASQLNPWALEGYRRNIPRLAARRRRRELELHPDVRLTVEGLHALVLAETGDEKAADDAAARYMATQLERGETPQ